jgi:transposase
MKAYSKDLRLEVLDALDRGMPRKEVALIFGISVPSIKRWLKRRRETGDVEPSPIPGPPAKKGALLERWLPSQLEEDPDLTLEEHCEAFEKASGVEVSTATMSRRISGLPEGGGWPLKKVPASHRARRRSAGALAMAGEALRREEAGVRGREWFPYLHDAPEGESSQGEAGVWQGPEEPGQEPDFDRLDHPGGREGGMGEAVSIEGATDAELFETYVEEFLAPTLKAGQVVVVVVLDGLGAHRTERVRELVEGRGAELVFLPSYSPDLNPIEEAFSKKIKNLVRKAAARTREALDEAMGEALGAVTLEDAAGWFSHCGYEAGDQYS